VVLLLLLLLHVGRGKRCMQMHAACSLPTVQQCMHTINSGGCVLLVLINWNAWKQCACGPLHHTLVAGLLLRGALSSFSRSYLVFSTGC
jgi:hypothetical protein